MATSNTYEFKVYDLQKKEEKKDILIDKNDKTTKDIKWNTFTCTLGW